MQVRYILAYVRLCWQAGKDPHVTRPFGPRTVCDVMPVYYCHKGGRKGLVSRNMRE